MDPVPAPLAAPAGAGTGQELGRFLRARRARLRPGDVGLVDHGRRRVPGLRREEVAMLAGLSPAYYTRLEQGDGGRVSDEVTAALARALRLEPAETEHLFRLMDPLGQVRRERRTRAAVRPALQGLLDAVVHVPAFIVGRRSDILAWNAIGAAVFGDPAGRDPADRNWARLVFLDEGYRDLFVDWREKAADVVGQLRLDAGRHPADRQLAALVGELSMRSSEFATLWAQHDIRERCHGIQRLRHPEVGELELRVESFRVAGDEDVALATYHPEPGSPTQESLRLLGTLAATSRPVVERDVEGRRTR
jgi:transcriptional regulator with XRE-family HTH domain